MNPNVLFHAAAIDDRFQGSELQQLDDRVLADIGLERQGPAIFAMDENRLKRIRPDSGATRIAQFIASIITKGGFRQA